MTSYLKLKGSIYLLANKLLREQGTETIVVIQVRIDGDVHQKGSIYEKWV